MTKQPYKNRARLFFLQLCLTGPLSACVAHAQTDGKDLIARIEAPQTPGAKDLDALTLEQLMERFSVPGVSVAVVKDFKIHWAKAYGVADRNTGRPVDTGTAFQAASIGKPVTALAAMRLVEAGRLNLDADVNTVLQSWHVPRSEWTARQAVTPRSLFSHTSGADDGFGFPGYDPLAPLPTMVHILEGKAPSNVGKVVFARAPFTASKYSGGGLVIMQLALTELSGQPFAPWMQGSVLGPLRMANSTFEPLKGQRASHAAVAHNERGQRMGPAWRIHPEQAAAGLWSTPSDLANFIIEIQSAARGPRGKILSRQSAREMLPPVGVGRYGVGLAISQRGQGWYFTHGGSNWGYRAFMLGHVRHGYGFVIMTNGDNGSPLIDQLADRIANAYAWDSVDKPAHK